MKQLTQRSALLRSAKKGGEFVALHDELEVGCDLGEEGFLSLVFLYVLSLYLSISISLSLYLSISL